MHFFGKFCLIEFQKFASGPLDIESSFSLIKSLAGTL
jgi:hypothetical protein